jgi:hypothetical protein
MSHDPRGVEGDGKFSGIKAGDVNYGPLKNDGATTGHVVGDNNTIIGMRHHGIISSNSEFNFEKERSSKLSAKPNRLLQYWRSMRRESKG